MNKAAASTNRSSSFDVNSGDSDHLKPSGKGRTQTDHFEGRITLSGTVAARGRDESTQRVLTAIVLMAMVRDTGLEPVTPTVSR